MWLHIQFPYLYFLSPAACSLSDAAYTLGLASRMPGTATISGPQSGFSGPSVACTPSVAACVLSWIAVTCFWSHIKFSICIALYISVFSLIRRPRYMRAKHLSSCRALQAHLIIIWFVGKKVAKRYRITGLFAQSVHGDFALPICWAAVGFLVDGGHQAHAPRRWAKAYRAVVLMLHNVLRMRRPNIKKHCMCTGSSNTG